MIPFVGPKYLKEAALYIKGAEKRLAYHSDLWSAETVLEFKSLILRLKGAVKERNPAAVSGLQKEIDVMCGKYCPMPSNPGITENVEVFLVAIIIALGIRTYFLQPFTIPTSSMAPTLYGITGQSTKDEPPNAFEQVTDFVMKGRSYFNIVAKDDETITDMRQEKRSRFLTYTKITTDKNNTYWVRENKDSVVEIFFPEFYGFQGVPRKSFKKGEPIVRGYVDTGDHVFVDKMSYHFRTPTRGEVFVFTTQGVPVRQHAGGFTQYYIKRLAGLPGDELRIDAPNLYVNGKLAEESTFQRVMNVHPRFKDGIITQTTYNGYSHNVPPSLTNADATVRVPDNGYYALGDNSYRSSDSRAWGHVPEDNLVGVGVFVYWPFSRVGGTHFGLIR